MKSRSDETRDQRPSQTAGPFKQRNRSHQRVLGRPWRDAIDRGLADQARIKRFVETRCACDRSNREHHRVFGPASRSDHRHHGILRDRLVPMHSGNLLDQIHFASQILPKRWGQDLQGLLVLLDSTPEPCEDLAALSPRHFDPKDSADARSPEQDLRTRPSNRLRVDESLEHLPSSELQNPLATSQRSPIQSIRVDVPLETMRRGRMQFELTSRSADRHRNKRCGFDQQVDRRLGHLALQATHDTPEGQSSLAIGNDNHLGIERVASVIDGLEIFFVAGRANDDLVGCNMG